MQSFWYFMSLLAEEDVGRGRVTGRMVRIGLGLSHAITPSTRRESGTRPIL